MTRQDRSQSKLTAFFGHPKENSNAKYVSQKQSSISQIPALTPIASTAQGAPKGPAQAPGLAAAKRTSSTSSSSSSSSAPPAKKPMWWTRASKAESSSYLGSGGLARKKTSEEHSLLKRKIAPWENKIREISQSRPSSFAKKTSQLSEEQQQVLDTVLQGSSVFFTGAAGTGKSFLLHSIIGALRNKYLTVEVAITATTGLAALNIGGQTIHRWGGLGLGRDSVQSLAKRIGGNEESRRRWVSAKVLIIDEISMLDSELFSKMEELARIVRKNTKPFGGIQLVFTGDFFQLPPVAGGRNIPSLCFEAESWKKCVSTQMLLIKVFRQKDDRLIQMLNAMRHGRLTPDIIAKFKSLDRAVRYDDGFEATELYPRLEQVTQANNARIKVLNGPVVAFHALDSGNSDERMRESALQNLRAPKLLELKVGAQVLVIQNMNDKGLVNGSRGRVTAFVSEMGSGPFRALIQRQPVALEVYTTLSNNGGQVTPDLEQTMSQLTDDEREQLLEIFTQTPKYPMVNFGLGKEELILPVEFNVQGPGPKYQTIATREQLPLILSWALSIHKAQGQTLDRVVVNLTRVFEKGQAYVAVSRATSFDRLQVIGFDPRGVTVDPRVVEFYKTLESPNTI